VVAYTLTSAYAEFMEQNKGSIAVGKLADLAVLSQDIFTVPATELPKTRAVLTLVGGKVVLDTHPSGIRARVLATIRRVVSPHLIKHGKCPGNYGSHQGGSPPDLRLEAGKVTAIKLAAAA
jgi:hypothetical protein